MPRASPFASPPPSPPRQGGAAGGRRSGERPTPKTWTEQSFELAGSAKAEARGSDSAHWCWARFSGTGSGGAARGGPRREQKERGERPKGGNGGLRTRAVDTKRKSVLWLSVTTLLVAMLLLVRAEMLPARTMTATRAACFSAMCAVFLSHDAINRLIGQRFDDEAMERRFTDERVGYARTAAEGTALMLQLGFGTLEGSLVFRPTLGYAAVAGLNAIIMYTYRDILRSPAAAPARPYGLSIAWLGSMTWVDWTRSVLYIWLPIYATAIQTERWLQSEQYALMYQVAIPITMLVIPGVTIADHLGNVLNFLGFFAPYHWRRYTFWGPLLGMNLMMLLYRRAERECFRRESAANAQLSRALRFLSHEVRNQVGPCSSIIAAQQFNNPDDQRALLLALGSVNGILSNVLLMAQLDDEKAPVSFPRRIFRLRDWMDVTAAIGQQNVRDGVEFLLAAGDSDIAEQWVLGALPALTQVVSNVLSNACKFTSEGAVVLSWTFVEALVAHEDGAKDRRSSGDDSVVMNIEVVCEDTGCGIPQEKLPGLLGHFGQVQSGDPARHEGTGLGMPLAKRLLERMGGTFEVRSQVGVGTTVRMTVSLPARRPETDAAADAAGGGALIARLLSRIHLPRDLTKDVLAVDDSRLCRMVYERACRQKGLTVALAGDGIEAVQRVQDGEKFGLVILDHDMPQMDGLNAAAACRAAGYCGVMIMVTGNEYTDRERENRCKRCGLDHIFTKGDVPGINGLLDAWGDRRQRQEGAGAGEAQ